MRISQYLARSGIASRRKAEKIVQEGRVRVNGVTITALAFAINPEADRVEVDGVLVHPEKFLYIILNKPAGYLSSVSDNHGRQTVLKLVNDLDKRLYPVGRLDVDSEGLLLLTNDGDFTNFMIHPRYKIEKTYQVWVEGNVKPHEIVKLQQGVELEDGLTAPARVKELKSNRGNTLLEVVIHEGRKRQVKRMCQAVSHPVISLKRVGFGFLTLQGVPLGKYRCLTPDEVRRLEQAAEKGQV